MVHGRNASVSVLSPSLRFRGRSSQSLVGNIRSSGLLYPKRYKKVCAISAWKPILGRSTASSVSIIAFQLCIPPQQISPSAASFSPYSAAASHASRKVWAINFVLFTGSSSQPSGLLAESIRMTPLGRIPNSRSFFPKRLTLRTVLLQIRPALLCFP